MAEQNLGNAIELLRMENAKQSQEQVSSTDKINASLEKFLDNMKAMAGDKEEERRDKKKKKKEDEPEGAVGFKKSDFTGGFGLKGLLAGITVAVAGFVTGIATYFKLLVQKIIPKSFTRAFKNIAKAFKAGRKGVQTLAVTSRGMFRQLNLIEKGIRALGVGFQSAVNGLKTAGKFIKGGFLKAVNGIKSVILFLGKPFIALSKALTTTTGGVGVLSKVGATIGEFFKSIGTKIKGFTDLFGKSGFLGKIFNVFRALGTKLPVIGWLISGVMGIFDGFRDASKEVGGFGDKVIRFMTSGIGTFVGVVFGGIGDIVKWAVSKLAGLFGFDGASAWLDSWSFEEILISMFDSIGNFLINDLGRVFGEMMTAAGEGIRGFFSAIGDKFIAFKNWTFDVGTMLQEGVDKIGEFFVNAFTSAGEGIVAAYDYLVTKAKDTKDGIMAKISAFADQFGNKLREFIGSLLPDPDSLAGKLVPDALYDFVGEKAPAPAEKTKTPEAAASDVDTAKASLDSAIRAEATSGGSSLDTESARMMLKQATKEQADLLESQGKMKEAQDLWAKTLEATDLGNIEDRIGRIMDGMEDVVDTETKKTDDTQIKGKSQTNLQADEELLGRKYTEKELLEMIEQSKQQLRDQATNGELDTVENMQAKMMLESNQEMLSEFRKREGIGADNSNRGAEIDKMSKAIAKGSSQVNVIAPQSSQVTNNNTQQTAAIMPQNQPTVDQNDRTYHFAA